MRPRSTSRMARLTSFFVLAALCAGARTTEAATITWNFEGQVTFVADAPGGPYSPLLGSAIQGSFTFESEAIDMAPAPNLGRYSTGAWNIVLPGLGSTWLYPTGTIEIARNDFFGSPFYPCPGGCLVAQTGGIPTSNNPGAPPPLGRFEFRIFEGDFPTDALMLMPPASQTAGFAFDFPIVTAGGDARVGVASVPEPATLLLVLSGAGLAAGRRRFWTRQAPGRLR